LVVHVFDYQGKRLYSLCWKLRHLCRRWKQGNTYFYSRVHV